MSFETMAAQRSMITKQMDRTYRQLLNEGYALRNLGKHGMIDPDFWHGMAIDITNGAAIESACDLSVGG